VGKSVLGGSRQGNCSRHNPRSIIFALLIRSKNMNVCRKGCLPALSRGKRQVVYALRVAIPRAGHSDGAGTLLPSTSPTNLYIFPGPRFGTGDLPTHPKAGETMKRFNEASPGAVATSVKPGAVLESEGLIFPPQKVGHPEKSRG